MSSGTALTAFDSKQLAVLDEVASQCDIALREAGNNVSGALAVAENMQRLRQLITPKMLESLAALQGTALGFRTDRRNAKSGPKEYSADELRDPFIEATVRGFRAIGNEFNIIAGNFYGAKAGFERKVRTFPGLSEFNAFYDVEETAGGFARVQCAATWVLNGRPDQFTRRKESIAGKPFDNRIRVRVNDGMGYDALIGKAQRKFFAAVYDYLINADAATPEGDPDDTIVDPEAGHAMRRAKLFDDKPAPEADSPKEDDQDDLIESYRTRLSAIGARTEVSNVARDAAKDSGLSANGRKSVMDLCAQAHRVWPQKIATSSIATKQARPEEAASAPEATTEQRIAEEVENCRVFLEDNTSVIECKAKAEQIESWAKTNPWFGSDAVEAVKAMAKSRIEQLHNQRGQRSNGGK